MASIEDIRHVAIYLRLSRDEENKGVDEILSNHRKTLIEHCENKKWSYDIYQEIASGADRNRQQLDDMLAKVENNEYDAVVVHAVDRLGRDKKHTADIQEKLFVNDTYIATPEGIFDWDNDSDMMLLDFNSLLAAQELRITKRRLQKGKLAASEKGLWVHGDPPLGYDKDPATRKLVKNKNAEHITYIFKAIADGKTIPEVCHELNEVMGVRTRTGKKFAYNSICRIVNNEVYTGALIYNKYWKKRKERPKNEWKRIENAHPAIIDKETWGKVNKLVNTYSFSAPRSKNKIYPTTKLIFCGNCGKVQGTQMAHTGKLYIKICRYCKNRTYQYEPILKLIKEDVGSHIPKILKDIKELEQNDNGAEMEYKKKQVQKQINKINTALDTIETMRIEGDLNPTRYRERKAEYEEKMEQLYLELQEIERQNPQEKIANLHEMKQRIEYLLQNWQFLDGEGLTDEEVNRSLHFIIERIEWTYGKGDKQPTMKIKYK
ncbi:recombinase family protein [Bacillus cereus]|nr:recombinase family protein [Bacillus cereus]MEB9570212.1 recombinase family protein [Bacillus cereus]